MKKEIWKECYGYPDYEVSTFGNIRSKERIRFGRFYKPRVVKGRILRPARDSDGYRFIGIRKNFVRASNKMSRLIALTFIANPENKPQVNHRNGIRNDDRVENLEWVTGSENIRHSIKTLGRKMYLIPAKHRGEHPSAKPIVQLDMQGNEVAIFECISDAADLGFTKTKLWAALTGRQKQHGGYKWRYL